MLPPGGSGPFPPLPGNVTIAVTRQGDKPAKILVTRGEQKWEVAENELDKLPADLRPYVERMLGRGAASMVMDYVPAYPVPRPVPPPPKVQTLRAEPTPSTNIEKRLEEMNHQLENLRHSVDELRAKQAEKNR